MALRISTASIYNRTQTSTADLQLNLARITEQISSGRKDESFPTLGRGINPLQFAETRKVQTDKYQSSIQQANIYIDSYDRSISGLIDTATDFLSVLTQRRAASGDSVPVDAIADGKLKDIESHLNTQINGQYVFAGDRTNKPAVNDLQVTNLSGNTPTSNYYLGDGGVLNVRASEQLEIKYGIKADEDAFQKLIGAIHLAKQGHLNDDDTGIAKAIDLLNDSIKGLTALQTRNGNNSKLLADADSIHTKVKVQIDKAVADITETDVVEATVRLKNTETTLTAAYNAFSRIVGLQLFNFLK